MSRLAIRLQAARKAFGEQVVLDGIDLDVPAGQFVAVLGKSGTGKTTLLRILAGLDRPDSGTVLVPPARTVVFQEPRLIAWKRVLGNVTLGQRRIASTVRAGRAALAEVGLDGHERDWPGTLSGGEAQRVALARALVRQPELLLLDEPFAALDALTRLTMQRLVSELHQRHGPAVLIVTHDVDEAVQLADRILVLRHGALSLDLLVDLPRPRMREDPGFTELRLQLLAELGVTPTGRHTGSRALDARRPGSGQDAEPADVAVTVVRQSQRA